MIGCGGVRRSSDSLDCDFHLIGNVQKESVRVLEAPTYIRYRKLDRGCDAFRAALRLDGHDQLVIRTVKAEDAVNVQLKISVRGNLALEPVWCENYLREFVAFENFPIHPPVASFAAAIAAGGIHNDLTGCFVRCRVEANRAVLQGKRSVDRVHGAAKCKFHVRVIRIEAERELLCSQRWGKSNSQEENRKIGENLAATSRH